MHFQGNVSRPVGRHHQWLCHFWTGRVLNRADNGNDTQDVIVREMIVGDDQIDRPRFGAYQIDGPRFATSR